MFDIFNVRLYAVDGSTTLGSGEIASNEIANASGVVAFAVAVSTLLGLNLSNAYCALRR